jgi:hypothetical protein
MKTATKRVRYDLVFDKKKDRLTKQMEQRSRSTQRSCLCRNQFRRYLDVRAAYFVDQGTLDRCSFYLIRVGSRLLAIRPLARLTSAEDFNNYIANSRRGAQRLYQDEMDSVCWLCQIIGKDAKKFRVVCELVVPEWLLENSTKRFKHD